MRAREMCIKTIAMISLIRHRASILGSGVPSGRAVTISPVLNVMERTPGQSGERYAGERAAAWNDS